MTASAETVLHRECLPTNRNLAKPAAPDTVRPPRSLNELDNLLADRRRAGLVEMPEAEVDRRLDICADCFRWAGDHCRRVPGCRGDAMATFADWVTDSGRYSRGHPPCPVWTTPMVIVSASHCGVPENWVANLEAIGLSFGPGHRGGESPGLAALCEQWAPFPTVPLAEQHRPPELLREIQDWGARLAAEQPGVPLVALYPTVGALLGEFRQAWPNSVLVWLDDGRKRPLDRLVDRERRFHRTTPDVCRRLQAALYEATAAFCRVAPHYRFPADSATNHPLREVRNLRRWLAEQAIPVTPEDTLDSGPWDVLTGDEWISTARLVQDTIRLMGHLPSTIDAVCGVARSGMLPASVLALQLHVPLLGASGQQCVEPGRGSRLNEHRTIETVLVIDDTICSGRATKQAAESVRERFPSAKIYIAGVYAIPGKPKVDFIGTELPGPHYLEWNWPNSLVSQRAAWDFDGIFCEDVACADDDFGDRYLHALRFAVPKMLARKCKLFAIITARPEFAREVTEEWLARWGMRCRSLVMGPWRNAAERVDVPGWKADRYRESGAEIFVESCPIQAREIAKRSGLPVLCPAAGGVIRKQD